MGEARLHVVFGTGQAGKALTARLAGRVSRSGRCPGTGRRLGGLTGGPPVPPIPGWPRARPRAPRWRAGPSMPRVRSGRAVPALQRGVLAAAERAGALPVALENSCGSGPAEDKAGPPREKEKGS